jgi:hypothetical protein
MCVEEETGVITPPAHASQCMSTSGLPLVEGETWQVDTCTQCICHQGEPLCQVEHCPPVLCIHPVRMPGKCCAICPGGKSIMIL